MQPAKPQALPAVIAFRMTLGAARIAALGEKSEDIEAVTRKAQEDAPIPGLREQANPVAT